MKIIIDIGHPAHVHLFKYFAREMRTKGHTILFTARDKENEIYLLKKYQFPYKSFGKHYKSTSGKIFGLVKFNLQMIYYSLKFKPDLYLSHGSVYAAMTGWLLRKPHISMEDSGNMEQIRLYRPFTNAIIVPEILPEQLGVKEIRYNSFHEMAYLHPKYFVPQAEILNLLGLKKDQKYAILRFVSWTATHDSGHKGFSLDDKRNLIHILKAEGLKIIISSESSLPLEFNQYAVKFPPELMHDALYFASFFIGEGATMASESGVLGTTAVYVNSIRRSYCEIQEQYNLVFNFQKSEDAIVKINEILAEKKLLEKNIKGRENLINESIDLTAFLIWFVENYPESFRIMKEKPDYPYNFK
jgi:predicted glycosyltransferase